MQQDFELLSNGNGKETSAFKKMSNFKGIYLIYYDLFEIKNYYLHISSHIFWIYYVVQYFKSL